MTIAIKTVSFSRTGSYNIPGMSSSWFEHENDYYPTNMKCSLNTIELPASDDLVFYNDYIKPGKYSLQVSFREGVFNKVYDREKIGKKHSGTFKILVPKGQRVTYTVICTYDGGAAKTGVDAKAASEPLKSELVMNQKITLKDKAAHGAALRRLNNGSKQAFITIKADVVSYSNRDGDSPVFVHYYPTQLACYLNGIELKLDEKSLFYHNYIKPGKYLLQVSFREAKFLNWRDQKTIGLKHSDEFKITVPAGQKVSYTIIYKYDGGATKPGIDARASCKPLNP